MTVFLGKEVDLERLVRLDHERRNLCCPACITTPHGDGGIERKTHVLLANHSLEQLERRRRQ